MTKARNFFPFIFLMVSFTLFPMSAQATTPLHCYDWVRQPSLEELAAVPFKPVDKTVLNHPVERRGFVTVPLDYTRPKGPQIQIFHRFMPAVGHSVDDPTVPVAIVINGGPGSASWHYRPYDFDYTGQVPPKSPDYLGELNKRFALLMLDQRGTDGNSAPLDMDSPLINPAIVARYFDSVNIALDHYVVINRILPITRPFFMIAQSYGGMVGVSYLTNSAVARAPKGICFSSAAFPHTDIDMEMRLRRQSQKNLNEHLVRTRPDLVEKILKVRAHISSLGSDPNQVNFLWRFLGNGEDGIWQTKLERQLNKILAMDSAALKEWVLEESGVNLLNYILSNAMTTPGQTDATMAAATQAAIPYEHPWMLDENWMLMGIGRDGTWRQRLVEAIDKHPHPGIEFPSVARIQQALRSTRALFSLADDDAMLPFGVTEANAKRFHVEGVTTQVVLPGGHKAIFLPTGADAFYQWAMAIP